MVGVGAVVVDAAGRVLLVKRGTEPMKGHWSIPGGLVELGETLVEAIQREIAEETGLTVKPEAVVEVIDRIYQGTRQETNEGQAQQGAEPPVRYHYVIVDYWCRVLDGIAQPASDAADLLWATPAEWLDTNIYGLEALTRQVLEKSWRMALAAGVHG
jgi:ADP-ribose pyrophosphatase YjhB (NUDIX family)